MSTAAETQEVPKAILYSWKTSVWVSETSPSSGGVALTSSSAKASVPLLCLHEKGYSEDEYIVKQVDISQYKGLRCCPFVLTEEPRLLSDSQGRELFSLVPQVSSSPA